MARLLIAIVILILVEDVQPRRPANTKVLDDMDYDDLWQRLIKECIYHYKNGDPCVNGNYSMTNHKGYFIDPDRMTVVVLQDEFYKFIDQVHYFMDDELIDEFEWFLVNQVCCKQVSCRQLCGGHHSFYKEIAA